jgi:rhodanese-related sulfurtransferase
MRIAVPTLFCLVLLFTAGCSEEPKESQVSAPAEAAEQKESYISARTEAVERKEATPQKVFQTISPAAARELLEQNADVLLVDVRTPQEIKQMSIDGSVAVPVGDVIRGRLTIDPNQPVLLVCALGGRSYIAGKALASRGHRVVYNLGGGIDAWYRAGLPVKTNM